MRNQRTSIPQNMLKTAAFFSFIFMIMLATPSVQAQNSQRTVTGVVNTNDGPLAGATVVLKGTAVAASTDDKGAFTFPRQLKENDILVVSFLGYKNQEITIEGDTSFIEPFLEDIAVVIVAALRTEDPSSKPNQR